MDRGPGFYLLQDNDLLHAPNFVKKGGGNLYKEEKDSYIYPVDGFYWFDTESAARVFFGLPEFEINTEEGYPYA
tara:strand:+ start:777 stop:998 length:222 start_codon:yes stop_codon:yes gene_type:complete